ncbi:lon-related putative ATP-dependent protease [Oikeobacillus pervagus]|uniref:endopeptidase La n=1 Tax=Oikeobacillus pervagus TaxID=1325931 RepID=A0AAJ1T4M1_9BACI|nr:ATP-binding protein [Oikeobacillus pervagus]MDQ0215136.1 lon-related putative ATP-dependent protease [Oikeobacillus pervagus]
METAQYQQLLSLYKVPVSKLSSHCDGQMFQFETTAEIEQKQSELIGQKRAVDAMDFGLTVKQPDYNLFVVGPSGTGRLTYTQQKVGNLAKEKTVPHDWCYVYNFENPDRPLAISLEAGVGARFHHDIEVLLKDIERLIRKTFSEEPFENKRRTLLAGFEKQIEQSWKDLEDFASNLNFRVEQTPSGIDTYPLRFGRPLEKIEYDRLTKEDKEELQKKSRQLEEKINQTINQIQKVESEIRKSLDLFMKQSVAYSIECLFQPLYGEYEDNPKVIRYLKAYFQDVVEHFSIFLPAADEKEEFDFLEVITGNKEQQLQRYTVNLLVNNKSEKGAPVIYETNPTFQNLFGKMEYKGALGNWTTDFTLIKPGALHLANGGYLILQASELLQQPYAWGLLKRMLQTGHIQIENLYEVQGAYPTSGLRPEPIPLRVKVIMIGSYYLFDLLASYDEDFYKLFKVKVEFDTEMTKDREHYEQMAYFVKDYSDREGLLPFHRRAVVKIMNYSSRLVEDQRKLSTRFQEITKLLVESSYWASRENSRYVDDIHIKKALDEQMYRSNRIFEKYKEMIVSGTIMVDTDGARVGQINGLAVMGTREYTFGIPSKITAQTFAGRSGIMNIERETSLSGQIHNKGLLILTGYLSGLFAKNRPIPLSASITFEQTYQMIDGDSASSTELYVLLSSLSGVPIKQGIAVTGSVNQWGEIQPIGGVNEKIEGFYHVCKEKGLTGEQGVMIPKQNIQNLMLHDDVMDAVEKGLFHVWAVENITEGIEILTGVSAGYPLTNLGEFQPESIFAKVADRFDQMYQAAQKMNPMKKEKEE